jgi:hypothetical protein
MGKKKGGIDALYINETKNFSPNISDVYSETLVYSPSSFKLGGSIIDVNHDYLNTNHTEIDHKYLSTDNLNLNSLKKYRDYLLRIINSYINWL